MLRTQVYLNDEQDRQLKRLAEASGRKQSELIREAIDLLIRERASADWRAAVRDACGLWAGRDDTDEVMGDVREGVRRRLADR
jgi:predicted transcriptional regulator